MNSSASKTSKVTVWPCYRWRRRLWVLLAVAWALALVVNVPFKSSGPSMWGEPIFTLSKSMHLGVYGFLAASAAWLGWPRRYGPLVWLGLVGHAMLTEWLQYLLVHITGRTGQWSDVGLDCLGIAVGAALGWLRWRKG